ncbi:YlxM family DNA-binding protein [Desulfitibacter alkalitolerans]|uniref:YlxM family DNA-binding protein n=1 Tax=Desulfitibacter alkalitolerans TaxID=264641 RepID=UPI000AC0FCCC|nr:YlxM family DNA-binding protein [Desulfitibacter alkalitolerans]
MNTIPKINESARLFDFYGTLLTEKQQLIFKLYYYDDLSLGEIAQELNISRQAVYDIIKRTENLLKNYEDNLQLWAKYQKTEKNIKDIKPRLLASNIDGKEKQRLLALLDSLLEN